MNAGLGASARVWSAYVVGGVCACISDVTISEFGGELAHRVIDAISDVD
jgi:hypothetical protein